MIVADTNLLAYLPLSGQHTEAAEQVLERDPEWAAPWLWRSELRSVLTQYLRRRVLTREVGVAIFRQATEIVDGREYEVDTDRFMALASESACSAYDCEFAALAEDLDVPLVSSDARILSGFPGRAESPRRLRDATSGLRIEATPRQPRPHAPARRRRPPMMLIRRPASARAGARAAVGCACPEG